MRRPKNVAGGKSTGLFRSCFSPFWLWTLNRKKCRRSTVLPYLGPRPTRTCKKVERESPTCFVEKRRGARYRHGTFSSWGAFLRSDPNLWWLVVTGTRHLLVVIRLLSPSSPFS